MLSSNVSRVCLAGVDWANVSISFSRSTSKLRHVIVTRVKGKDTGSDPSSIKCVEYASSAFHRMESLQIVEKAKFSGIVGNGRKGNYRTAALVMHSTWLSLYRLPK